MPYQESKKALFYAHPLVNKLLRIFKKVVLKLLVTKKLHACQFSPCSSQGCKKNMIFGLILGENLYHNLFVPTLYSVLYIFIYYIYLIIFIPSYFHNLHLNGMKISCIQLYILDKVSVYKSPQFLHWRF